MKTPKYIKASNLPPRLSIVWPLVWWLILERFNAPGWVYGALYTVIAVVFIAECIRLWTGESVDLLDNDKKA